jgi:3-carboxy-cis,cis-muconate cycloisomerase
VSEASGGDRGNSSTLPHKRNPVGSALAIACARRVRAEASILLGAMAQEHERAAGAWQAEWEAMGGALAHTGGAAASLREALDGLEVRPARMRENLDAGGGLIMAEAVVTALAEGGMGRSEAHEVVQAVSVRATEGRTLGDELREDAQVSSLLSSEQIDRALDPAAYLGAAGAFVDRALARFEAPS